MVQIIQGSPSLGDLILQADLGGHFEKGYENAKKQSLLQKISDPKSTEMEKASAEETYIRKFGKAGDIIKLKDLQLKRQQEASLQGDLMNYNRLRGGFGNDQGQAQQSPLQNTLNGPMYAPPAQEMMMGGQGNQQPTQAIIDQSAPPAQEPDRDAINEAIAQISLRKPALGTVLQKQENQKEKNIQEQERQLGKSYEMSQKYREKTIQGDKAYHRSSAILDRLLEVGKDPSVNSKPAFVALMQKFNVPTEVWGNPKEAEIEKLSGELTKELPESWRGRILSSEFGVLLRTLPQLVNTPEGRTLIARNMKLLMEPSRIEYQEMEKLKKEYQQAGKKLPYDFQDQVYARMNDQMNALQEEFVRGTDEAVSMSERIKRGGTLETSPTTQKSIPGMKPVPQGKVRLTRGGKFFDVPEGKVAKMLEFNKDLKRVDEESTEEPVKKVIPRGKPNLENLL